MRPRVVAQPTEFNHSVLEKCPRLRKDYNRHPLLFNHHMETIWASYFRTHLDLKLRRECMKMPDGGMVTLDMPEDESTLLPDAPVVVLIAGLTGGSNCSYVQCAMRSAMDCGIRAISFNSRGMASGPMLTPQFYSASYTEDLRNVVDNLYRRYSGSTLLAIGWSLGANILVNYLGEEGQNSKIHAAASLCNPFNLCRCQESIQTGFSRIYDSNLAASMKKSFRPHMHLFEGYEVHKLSSAKTVREVDDIITRVTFGHTMAMVSRRRILALVGWESVDAYYRGSSSADSIIDVRIPLLCIQAEDDPICPSDAIPEKAIQANKHCTLVVTPYGGHLGWCSTDTGLFGPPWTDGVVLEWFSAILSSGKRAVQ